MDGKNSASNQKEVLFQRSKKRAFDCLNDGEYSRAFAHLIVAMNIEPEEESVTSAFLFTLSLLSNELEAHENWNDLVICYQEALAVLPRDSQVLHGLATVLFRLGHLETATSYFRKAYRENPFFTPSLYCLDNIRSSLVARWHFMMLNDKSRNAAFVSAIQKAVKKGCDSVLDIGAGTGILSMIASDCGAKAVYACEVNPTMFAILQSVIEANKKNIHLINKSSYDISIPDDMPERIDLVVTETFDAGLFGEHILEAVSDAWERLLKKNICFHHSGKNAPSATLRQSRIIPQSATVWSVPIQCEYIRKHLRVDSKALDIFGLPDIDLASSCRYDEPYSTEKLSELPGGYTCLSAPESLLAVNFNNYQEVKSLLHGKSFSAKYECHVKGRVDGIAVWFNLNLDDEVTISTSPQNTGCCWEQAIFYILPDILRGPSDVESGSTIEACFECKGHLSLRSVKTSSDDVSETSCSVDGTIIRTLNNYCSEGVLSLNLIKEKLSEKEAMVVDVSTVPILGLKTVLDGATKVVTLPSMYMRGIDEIQGLCNISKEMVQVMSYEDICAGSLKFDVIIINPVEATGLLKKNVLEYIAFLRSKSGANPPAVYPKKLGVYAVLIDSPLLHQRSKIVSDDNCMGYNISKFLNVYQSNIHQEIQLSALSHEKLCDSIKLCEIQLDQLSLEKNKLQSWIEFHGSVNVTIEKTGNISAIPFWFDMAYSPDVVTKTLSPNSLQKQAAIVPDDVLSVCKDDIVCVKWTCRNSCLFITVDKV